MSDISGRVMIFFLILLFLFSEIIRCKRRRPSQDDTLKWDFRKCGALRNWIALSMSILGRGTSQFLPKLAKLVYTARQVVSWQGRYNDKLDSIYVSTCFWCKENRREERERERGGGAEKGKGRERETENGWYSKIYGNFGR